MRFCGIEISAHLPTDHTRPTKEPAYTPHLRGGMERQWQPHSERGTSTRCFRDLDGAVVHSNNRLHNGQPEPRAACLTGPGCVRTPEQLENLVSDLRRDSFAMINDLNHGFLSAVIASDSQRDRAVLGSKPEGIAHEVADDLSNAVLFG